MERLVKCDFRGRCVGRTTMSIDWKTDRMQGRRMLFILRLTKLLSTPLVVMKEAATHIIHLQLVCDCNLYDSNIY
jgi:hypothetical protein